MMPADATPPPRPFATSHAYARMRDRYGVEATNADWGRALLDVTDGHALLTRRDGSREHVIVRIAGVAALAVYDPQDALFITVLPPGVRNWRARVGEAE